MQITGTTTGNGQTKKLQSGTSVASFTIVEEGNRFKNKEEKWVSKRTFINVSFFQRPNLGSVLPKGSVVTIEGDLTPRIYNGKDGEPRIALNFFASGVKVISWGRKSEASKEEQETTQTPTDDLPF